MREKYRQEVATALQKRFGFDNVMQIPKLEKIVVNIGVGKATQDPKLLDEAVATLRAVTGQQPVVTRARKAISNFKLRANMAVGCKVTLRQDRMYEFFDRLVSVVIPRIRDFRGLSRKSCDGRGNYG
ncbi:MAG: 50S ribosomal protein L5, partial [Chitinivibrionales bacterium]|nr:50S ribosomal protein L5 [Chitinivibrionales bacterium]